MKKLVELTVSEFVDLTASLEPAPGGGSAAALNGALGAGLAAMVCALTLGRKKYAEYEELARSSEEKLNALKDRFIRIIDSDTEAFNAVSAVFAMPRDSDEEKAARKAAMQEALKGCTVSPMGMMELAAEAMELVSALVGQTNATAASDLGCAALNLKAAIQGAWLNVRINVAGISDESFAAEYLARGEKLLARTLPLADQAYQQILNFL